jgi:hypothetical protein
MSLLKVNELQNYNGSSLTLTASTVSTSAQLNTGGNISVTGSLNVSDDSTTRSNLGLGSIATQASDSVNIDGGTIDGTTIGGTTAAAGTFTTFTSTGIDDNASSTALTIDTNGDVTIENGDLKIGSAGKGIDFSNQTGTSNPDAGGEILSHYEEGSFTPDFEFSGGNTGVSSTKAGRYQRIGNTVHVLGKVNLSDKGSSSGSVRLVNLPFNVTSDSINIVGSIGAGRVNSGATTYYLVEAVNGQDYLEIYGYYANTSGNRFAITDTMVSDTSFFFFNFTYRI